MPTQCSRDLFGFARVEGRQVEAAFDGGDATSGAGALLFGDPAELGSARRPQRSSKIRRAAHDRSQPPRSVYCVPRRPPNRGPAYPL